MKLSLRASRAALWSGALVLVVSAAACGSDGDASPSSPGPADAGGDGEVAADASSEASQAKPEMFPVACRPGAFCRPDLVLPSSAVLTAIDGRGRDEGWIVGNQGIVLHYRKPTWTVAPMPTEETFDTVTVRASGEVWALSSLRSVYVRRPKSSGEPDSASDWSNVRLPADFAALPSESTAKTIRTTASPADATWSWASSGGGNATFLTRIRVSPSPPRSLVLEPLAQALLGGVLALDVHGTSKDDLWIVGELGLALKVTAADGPQPVLRRSQTRTRETLNSVWAAAPEDVWAVGNRGLLLRHASAQEGWRTEPSPVSSTLRVIRGTSASDLWAVGDDATILHFDGKAWRQVAVAGLPRDQRPRFYGLLPLASDDVWALGEGGLFHFIPEGGAP